MTQNTFGGSAPELSVNMTAFTGQKCMGSIKIKPDVAVIELQCIVVLSKTQRTDTEQ